MANRVYSRPSLNLAAPSEKPFFVDMERFFEFSFWIAEELTDLVAEHEFESNRQDSIGSVDFGMSKN